MSTIVHEYTAPTHWAPYLINDDCSGMDDEDIAACDSWAATLPSMVVACTSAEDSNHPGFLRRHDAADFAPYGA